ncbi:MAG: pilus assembly protein PilZ [Gammaproteobacteria bacterium]|nr:MAG: pilus assembly protein PilZ [Gammaproteobacteria bacterium]
MDNVRDFSEKRDFIRMKVNTEITIRMNNSDETIEAVCHDLSGTGMLIEADEMIKEGEELFICIPSNNQAFPALEATAKIIRCTKKDNGKFELGAAILDIKK